MTAKQTLIEDVYKRMEYGMTGRKNQNKVKLTYLRTCLRIHLAYLLCWFDN